MATPRWPLPVGPWVDSSCGIDIVRSLLSRRDTNPSAVVSNDVSIFAHFMDNRNSMESDNADEIECDAGARR
jgi:hypothetical protein